MADGPKPRRRASAPEAGRRIVLQTSTWRALDELAQQSGCSVQELAEEAVRDLLKKHRQPRTLREALRASARQQPANDCIPPRARRSS